jgi:hypothetical protein
MISSIHDVNCGLVPMLGRTRILPVALDMIGLTRTDAGETIEDVLKAELVDKAFKSLFCFAGEMGYDSGSHCYASFIAVVRPTIGGPFLWSAALFRARSDYQII